MASDTVQTEPQIDPRAALAALGYPETTEPQRGKGGWETLLWRFAPPDGREHSLRGHYLPGREEERAAPAAPAKTLAPSTSSLIHMDFPPLNLVSDGAAVTGVIDWPRAAAGDPRADLARTEITLLAA